MGEGVANMGEAAVGDAANVGEGMANQGEQMVNPNQGQ